MTDQTRTITLDDVNYDVAQFSQGVQQAVGIYNLFSQQLQTARLESMKCEAAMQQVSKQITEAIKSELAAAAAEAASAVADVEVEVAPV